jgi:hypothetical protein
MGNALAVLISGKNRRLPHQRTSRCSSFWIRASTIDSSPRKNLKPLDAKIVTGDMRHAASIHKTLKMSKSKMYFTSAKAERELGYHALPYGEELKDALAWFHEAGYLGTK